MGTSPSSMRTRRLDSRVLLLVFSISLCLLSPAQAQTTSPEWKAGVARAEITPETSLWMAGYGHRDHPAEGTLHPIWVKVLALEDAAGQRAVLVTSDLLGLSKGVSDRVRDRLRDQFQLERAQVMLTSSHTHSGPALGDALEDVYPLDEAGKDDVVRYTRALEDRVVETVGTSLERLAPARLSSGTGVVRFAVNRRNNTESEVPFLTELEGPSDHAVPVLKVEDAAGRLLGVAFGYACHATVLSGYDWSGDYPGFAQIALEKMHPGATALFFAGAGADQNPIPRRSVALAEQYGRELSAAVDRVLQEPMQPLASQINTNYSEIEIALTTPPDREELHQLAITASGWHRRWATRLLDELERGKVLRRSYPYPVQVWQLGEQTMVALGGEVVVDYAVQLKRLLGPDLFVVAYANDVMGYIPSVRVLREGGYEGASSQQVYGLPSTWAADIEMRIIQEVLRLTSELNIALPKSRIE